MLLGPIRAPPSRRFQRLTSRLIAVHLVEIQRLVRILLFITTDEPERHNVTLRTFLPSGRSFFSLSVRTGRDRLCLVARE
jgi:hypothetical protein